MLGMLVGAFVLGDLADRIGRRRGTLVTLCLLSLGGMLNAASVNYPMYLITRFMMGCGGVTTFAIPFVLGI